MPMRMCQCGAVTPGKGPCPRCRVKGPEKRTVNATDRGYGYQWRTGLRRRQLARAPLCQYVALGVACTARATDVDHIVPKVRGGADALPNLQSLCHRHHSMKTAAENPQPSPSMRYRRAMSSRIDVSDLMGAGVPAVEAKGPSSRGRRPPGGP
jgi:5-methylcytosine-specific restriction endonuclease McrA